MKDLAVFESVERELNRQRNNIELIASENFVSPEIMELAGSVLTNKYAEGYPGKRYYGGCKFVDEVETLAKDFVKFMEPSMQMFNHIVEHKQIQLYIWLY